MRQVAMGKIAANGTILKASAGISISNSITPGDIFGPGQDIGYTVKLSNGLVHDKNYIVQLTAENYSENGPDYVFTTIALRYQSKKSFEVIIWADRIQTIQTTPTAYTIVPVKSDWHFVIYDI